MQKSTKLAKKKLKIYIWKIKIIVSLEVIPIIQEYTEVLRIAYVI